MTPKAAADQLNGREYGDEEPFSQFFSEMKAAGLVAVFGASDDLMEFRGAIYDEVGCYDGGTAYFNRDGSGLLVNKCSEEDCPYFAKERNDAVTIEARTDEPEYQFTYETKIPHETFEIVEDGEKYCRGIVFRLTDVAGVSPAEGSN